MTIPKRAPKPVSPALRAQLAAVLVEHIKSLEITQAEAADALGIAQSRLNLILRGRGASFSTDMLANLATRLGLRVRLSVTRPYRKS
jgi:predicted XRE-type DNA-binding protein